MLPSPGPMKTMAKAVLLSGVSPCIDDKNAKPTKKNPKIRNNKKLSTTDML